MGRNKIFSIVVLAISSHASAIDSELAGNTTPESPSPSSCPYSLKTKSGHRKSPRMKESPRTKPAKEEKSASEQQQLQQVPFLADGSAAVKKGSIAKCRPRRRLRRTTSERAVLFQPNNKSTRKKQQRQQQRSSSRIRSLSTQRTTTKSEWPIVPWSLLQGPIIN
jgi:hypothetical protein